MTRRQPNVAREYYPRALQYVSRVNEAAARGKTLTVSCSGKHYALALCLDREQLVRLGERSVRNHVTYYEVHPA